MYPGVRYPVMGIFEIKSLSREPAYVFFFILVWLKWSTLNWKLNYIQKYFLKFFFNLIQASTDERERSSTTKENSSNSPQRPRSEKMNSQLAQWRHHSEKQQLMAPVSETDHHHGPLKLQPRYPPTNMLSGSVTATKNVYRLNNRRPTVPHSYISRQLAASGVVTSSPALFKKPHHCPPHHSKYSINRTKPIVTMAAAAVEVGLITGSVSNKRKYDTSKYKYISPDAYKKNSTSPETIGLEYSKDSKRWLKLSDLHVIDNLGQYWLNWVSSNRV